jgi:N-acetylgalactosamine-N,N'-diacetylbacillosaminyl-diphospho-undecaprenol 4-alpha-N-acetylgalactosaminyltransferase
LEKEKILILTHCLLRGGAELVFAQLISRLSDRFEIHVILLHNGIAYPIPDNVKVTGLKEKLFENTLVCYLRIPFIAIKIARYCKKNDIKVRVSVLNRPTYINAFMKFFFRLKGKVVICERSNQAKHIAFFTKGNRILQRFFTKLMAVSYGQADLVLANSKLTAADIKETFKFKKEVRVIYNPIDIELINMKALVEPDFLFEKDTTYFIGVGVFRVEKNWAMLLEAMALLKHQKIKLILVGFGDEKKEMKLKELVKQLGIREKVIFVGLQENPFKYISRCHSLVLCSVLEGFPNVILESLALGIPVISTDCRSGPREILAPGTNPEIEVTSSIELAEYGILTPVNNVALLAAAMTKIFTDKELHQALAGKGKQRAAAFEAGEIANQFEKAFRADL